jgi:hypothetical protein
VWACDVGGSSGARIAEEGVLLHRMWTGWRYITGEARRWRAGRPSVGWTITNRAQKWSNRGGIDLIIWPGT